MGHALRGVGLAQERTGYRPPGAAVAGLMCALLVRLLTLLASQPPLDLSRSAAGAQWTLPLLFGAWVVAVVACGWLQWTGRAPAAPLAGFDLALWGIVGHEIAPIGLLLAGWSGASRLATPEIPLAPLAMAHATACAGLVAFGWGLALGVGGCVRAMLARRGWRAQAPGR